MNSKGRLTVPSSCETVKTSLAKQAKKQLCKSFSCKTASSPDDCYQKNKDIKVGKTKGEEITSFPFSQERKF